MTALASCAFLCATGCNSTEEISVDAAERSPDWEQDSHGSDTEPDYNLLFNDTLGEMSVHRIDLLIDESTYSDTMADLESIYGSCSAQGGGGGRPGGGGGRGGAAGSTADPIWVPIDVEFNGERWTDVGMRYKGNSSLQSAWQSCNSKLAFRLDFDQFESTIPSVEDQRFYGFKKMTFSNGYKDDSLIRDKLGADIFRRAGVPAARGAFAQIYATIGDAEPQYFGMYTMIEDPSNRLLDTQFGDDSGNLYKPESQWGVGLTDTELEEQFEKKTNEEEADWSDVATALSVLHSDTRTTDPALWRDQIGEVLDVPGFLRWAAVNQAMVNWDTYGCMAHNTYLYADPSDATESAPKGRFTWFPWDLNESLLVSGQCNYSGADGLIPAAGRIGDNWFLWRYLLDDAVYAATFEAELARAVEDAGGLDAPWINERINAYHDLISPYVVGPLASEREGSTFLSGANAFTSSSTELQDFVSERRTLVNDVLNR